MINKTFRAFLIAAAFAGLVSSCSNLESGPMSQPVFWGGQGQVKMAVLSGSIGFGGAMPSLAAASLANGVSRTAFPGIPSGDSVVYTIWAELSSDASVKYYADVADDKKSYTVSIPIGDEEKTYVIKGEVKSGETLLCSGTTEAFPISQSAPVAAKNLVLGGAASFSGKGEIALEILIDSATEIDSCAATCEGANIGEDSYAVSDGKVTVAVAEIDSGSRLVDFAFYKGASLLYQFSETVNVFDAMKTDTWVNNAVGGSPWLETTTDAGTGAKTTVCKVTEALVQSFALTEFYVDPTRQKTNPAGSGYTKGSGTVQNPCVSLTDAFAYMRDKDTDYTVYIIGTLEGPQTIPDTLKKEDGDPGDNYAKSLTLCGASGYSGGEPVSAIDAKSTETGDKQTALTLRSLVPVIIKDLKITGGWYNGNTIGGGGIYMKENTTLTLSSGALVMGNRSKGSGGGGIYINEGAALTIEDGAVIKDNIESSTDPDADGGGGAIYNKGSVIMKGGIIANNTADLDGGAIYCNDGSFTMEGGVIGDDNTAETATLEDDKHSNYSKRNGGGVYLGATDVNSSMSMTGGTIVYNAAAGSGGGIYVELADATICGSLDYNYSNWNGGAVYTTTGGEVALDGAGMTENKAANSGGAIYADAVGGAGATVTLKGRIKIPCKGKNYNDVYLHRATAKARVKVMEPLSTYGIALTITSSGYDELDQFVLKDSSVSWFDAVEKLGVLPELNADGSVSKRWCLREEAGGLYGVLCSAFGTKAATESYAQGDIVFCDGTHTAYSADVKFTQSQLAGAVAYIFYRGSNLSDDSSTRALGIGFAKPEKLVWCVEGAAAKDVAVSDISCVNTNMHSGTDSFVAGSVKNGSRNLEKISAAITAALGDDADDTNEPEKYPAFYYGINYKDRMVGEETISRFTSGSTLANNWYLPSAAELEKIRTTLTNINKVTVLCGGDKIDLNSDVHLWCLSSSTNADGTKVIVEDFIKAYATGDRYSESSKDYSVSRLVFAIREF